jgi:phosphohistidine phosphatase SixA
MAGPVTNRICRSAFLMFAALTPTVSHSESVPGQNLAAALRAGGYVILMRHASSPRNPPDAGTANADNSNLERQLDESGRSSARALGEAFRQLHIPIDQVLSSPTYRALETFKFAQLGKPTTYPQLGDGGQSMIADKSGARGAWLRSKAAESPAVGKNTLIVTHFPNILEAYPTEAAGLVDGEALVFHPDGRGAATLVARVKIDEWAHLDAGH